MDFSVWYLILQRIVGISLFVGIPVIIGMISIYNSIKIRKSGVSLTIGKYFSHVHFNTGKAAKNDANAALIFGIFCIVMGIGLPLALFLFSN
jgi:hypothetical protein